MAQKKIFVCDSCGAEFLAWSGRCDQCESWNTIKEIRIERNALIGKKTSVPVKVTRLAQIKSIEEKRISTGIGEFDLVLGGGFIPGSLVLLGGEPGIGKSTLVLQVASGLKKVLYSTGEESLEQIKTRASRLNIDAPIELINETDIDRIIATVLKNKPQLLIVDSIQVVYDIGVASTSGSVSQVKACGLKLQKLAKETGISIILVGHVTKAGVVAGPKTLEHLVDTVLYLEGQRFQSFRVLRTTKNRYGRAYEVGIFEMTRQGLKEVNQAVISRSDKSKVGSITSVIIEGSRPFLAEIQALTTKSFYGFPQRKSTGFDYNRLQLLVAVLSQVTRSKIGENDIYLNVVGGLKINEPSADLAAALAIMSAFYKKPLVNLAAIGEVGLSGEIYSVTELGRRIKEAKKLGVKKIIIPKLSQQLTISDKSIRIIMVDNLKEALKRVIVAP